MTSEVIGMRLEYNLDIDEESRWLIMTPSLEEQTLAFRVSEAGHFRGGPKFFTDRTGKEEYFLLFTVSGQGILHHLEQTLILERGHAALIYCREPQYYATLSDEPWEHYWVHFNGPGAEGYYDLINSEGIADVHIEDPHQFVLHFNEILRISDMMDRRLSILSAMHVTSLLTAMVMNRYTTRDTDLLPHHRDRLDQAIFYLQDHYHEDLKLRDLAGRAHMSVSHFARLFKQYTGMPPHEYLVNYRVNEAKKMLRGSGMSLAELAYQLGFTDETNFSRTFRRVTGTTPLNFRKMRN